MMHIDMTKIDLVVDLSNYFLGCTSNAKHYRLPIPHSYATPHIIFILITK